MKTKEQGKQPDSSVLKARMNKEIDSLPDGLTRSALRHLYGMVRENPGMAFQYNPPRALEHDLNLTNLDDDAVSMLEILKGCASFDDPEDCDSAETMLTFACKLYNYGRSHFSCSLTNIISYTLFEVYLLQPCEGVRLDVMAILKEVQDDTLTADAWAERCERARDPQLRVAIRGMAAMRNASTKAIKSLADMQAKLKDDRLTFEASKRLAGTYELVAAIDLLRSAFAQVEEEAQVQMLNKETPTFDTTANLVGVWSQLLKLSPALKTLRPGVERLGASNLITPAVCTMGTTQITSLRLDLGKYLAKHQLPPAERLSQYLNVLNSLIEIFPSTGAATDAKWAKPEGYVNNLGMERPRP